MKKLTNKFLCWLGYHTHLRGDAYGFPTDRCYNCGETL